METQVMTHESETKVGPSQSTATGGMESGVWRRRLVSQRLAIMASLMSEGLCYSRCSKIITLWIFRDHQAQAGPERGPGAQEAGAG